MEWYLIQILFLWIQLLGVFAGPLFVSLRGDGNENHTKIREGDNYKLTCVFETDNRYRIKWFLNGWPISDEYNPQSVVLFLLNVEENDSGEYMCKVFTPTGESVSNPHFLQVVSPYQRGYESASSDKFQNNGLDAGGISKTEKRRLKKERRQERRERRRNNKRLKKLTSDSFANTSPVQSLDDTLDSLPNMSTYQSVTSMTWLSNNLTSIWQVLQQMQKDIRQIRRISKTQTNTNFVKRPPQNPSSLPTKPHPQSTNHTEECGPWPVNPEACLDETRISCGGGEKGECQCGMCNCHAPNYGVHCQCNDFECESQTGVMCGGAGHGQCRCGSCICRPEYTGKSCQCSTSTAACQVENGVLCSGRGNCVCGRCQCNEGYIGALCEDSVYTASVCERLKMCVLCRVFNKKNPKCEECNIHVVEVDELELSQTTCVMISAGCIIKYAHSRNVTEEGAMDVFVPKGMKCP